MKSFPLTFAVFFQSIINPNMSVNKNMSKDALFSGEFNIDNNNSNYIAPGTYSDYIKGKRPIRATSVNQICKMSLEELVPRIKLLGLQDMPAVLTAIRNLLEIVDVSMQLKKELQEEANAIKYEELYLAKIFQLSLKCPNRKIELTEDDIKFLTLVGESEEENCSDSEDFYFFDLDDEEVISQEEKDASTEDANIQINRILNDYSPPRDTIMLFRGLKIYWQDVILPEDFEAFWEFVAPFVVIPKIINISVDEIKTTCALDLDNKVCKDGYLKLLETSWIKSNAACFADAFKGVSIEQCSGCVLLFYNCSIYELNTIITIIQEMNKDINIIFGLYVEEEQKNIKVKAVFRMKNPVVNVALKHQANSQSESDILIPNFLINKRSP